MTSYDEHGSIIGQFDRIITNGSDVVDLEILEEESTGSLELSNNKGECKFNGNEESCRTNDNEGILAKNNLPKKDECTKEIFDPDPNLSKIPFVI